MFLQINIVFSQENTLKKANTYLEDGNYTKSIKLYNQVLDVFPNNLEALFLRGFANEQIGKINEALSDYNKVVELYPNYSLIYYNRGILFYGKKDYLLALNDFETSFELDSTHYQSMLMIGLSEGLLKNYDKALNIFNQLINQYPNYPLAYANRGFLHMRNGKINLAIIDLKKAILLDPSDYKTLNNLMNTFGLDDNFKEQCTYIKDSISKKNYIESVYIQYSYALLMQEYYNESISVCNEAIKNGIKTSYILNNRGFCLLSINDYENALKDFEFSNKQIKNDPIILNNLGYTYFKLGEIEKGLDLINKSIEINDSLPYAYYNRANIYKFIGDNYLSCKDLYKSNELGFTQKYGNKVNLLIDEICDKKE